MPFALTFTRDALDDLAYLKKYEQRLVLDELELQLTNEPIVETRNRKPLEPNTLAEWELRIGVYRVFYDVDPAANQVKIKAVGYKEHNVLHLRGKEFIL